MSKKDLFVVKGTVIECKRGSIFNVKLNDNEHVVECNISGRMRKNKIKIILGDIVDIEMSPYDLSKGRISYRYK
jgi:translation initiation factor IF-1